MAWYRQIERKSNNNKKKKQIEKKKTHEQIYKNTEAQPNLSSLYCY